MKVGTRMIYLDNAATSFPKPECVYNRTDKVQRMLAVNAGRGSYSLSREATAIIESTRKNVARLFAATNATDVVFTPSATIASNIVIGGLHFDRYKTVYISPFEHNSIARPIELARQKYGFRTVLLPSLPNGYGIDLEETRILFAKQHPDYVFINHISNVTGVVLPVEELSKLAHEYEAIVIADCAQSAGLVNINLPAFYADFIIFAGHKNLYSHFGVGGFVRNCNAELISAFSGGTGSDSLNLDMPSREPGRFEFGSPNILAIASLNESTTWLDQIGMKAIYDHKANLMELLYSGLKHQKKVWIYRDNTGQFCPSVLSFNVTGYRSDEVGMILDQDYGIAVRTGFHCAPYVHDCIGSKQFGGTVRVGIGYFNSTDDINSLLAAISEL